MKTIFKVKRRSIQTLFMTWLCLLLHASGFATEISIPGTGRGIAINQADANWSVYGAWSTAPQFTVSGSPKRNATDDMQLCINNGDHTIYFYDSRPSGVLGPASIYFYYPFQIIKSDNYFLNCYIEGASEVSLAKYVGTSNGGDMLGYIDVETINSAHTGCQPYSFFKSLDPGMYMLRIPKVMSGSISSPSTITVNSAGNGYPNMCIPSVAMTSTDVKVIASGEEVTINFTSTENATYSWTTAGNANTNVSAGSQSNVSSLVKTITNSTSQTQIVTYIVTPRSSIGDCVGLPQTIIIYVTAACINGCDTVRCSDCIGSFAPVPGQKYVISAWVQESNRSLEMTYTGPAIYLNFSVGSPLGPFKASGEIIDGWQRIDEIFTVPSTASDVIVRLVNTGNNEVYFDDLRIHPIKASLRSFVYDPVSLRLMAELDENNYATFYEYDEEGKLIRLKKETERGVKTIKETVSSTRKAP